MDICNKHGKNAYFCHECIKAEQSKTGKDIDALGMEPRIKSYGDGRYAEGYAACAEQMRLQRELDKSFCMGCGKKAKLCTFLCKACYEHIQYENRKKRRMKP